MLEYNKTLIGVLEKLMLHNEPVQTLPLNNIVLQEVSQRVAEVDRVTRKSGQSVMHNLAYWVEFTV